MAWLIAARRFVAQRSHSNGPSPRRRRSGSRVDGAEEGLSSGVAMKTAFVPASPASRKAAEAPCTLGIRSRPGFLSERSAMSDKSPRQNPSKKSGKSIKEKRAEKRGKAIEETFSDKLHPSKRK